MNQRHTRTGWMLTALMVVIASPALAEPENPADDRWLAWHGCWHADGAPEDNLLCIVPDGDGVRFITTVAGSVQVENRLIADGTARPASEQGCSGTEQAQWSADRQRIFVTSVMSCGQDLQRKLTGIMAMKSATRWYSVQAITAGGEPISRVQQYSAVDAERVPASIAQLLGNTALARQTARYAAIKNLDLGDVKEAVDNVDAEVVVEWIATAAQPFDLTGKRLVALADSGVPPSVIDVLVAVSNPEHFAVRDVPNRDGRDDVYRRVPRGMAACDPFYTPLLGVSSYYYGDSRCSRYRYGYGFWGYDPYGWGIYSTPVIVVRNGSNQDPDARVTRKGYSRGRPKSDNAGTESSSSGGSSARPADKSSGGSSSGSSGSGRTAKPRDNK